MQLSDAEDVTHIRASYLAALEEEQFERLPGRAYARSFLHEYAQFLGLDPRQILDAFAEAVPEEDAPALQPVGIEHGSPIRRRRLVLALGGLVLLFAGVAAWRLDSGHRSPGARPRTSAHAVAPRSRTAHPAPHRTATATRVVLRAHGPCWLLIRAGSTLGPVVYEATLSAGRTWHYTFTARRRRLWVRIGAPWNLAVLLDGRSVPGLPSGPGNVLITRGGIEPA